MGPRREERKRFRRFIEDYLDELYAYADRELDYLVALGVLPEGALSPQDVVDQAVLEAWERWHERPLHLSGRTWLYGAVRRALAKLARQYAREPEHIVSLEAVVPDSDVDEQFWVYWEPDQVETWEDVVASEVPAAEEVVLNDMEIALLEETLKQLSPFQREAFQLYLVHDLPLLEVARLLHASPQAVRKAAEEARLRLHHALQTFRQGGAS
ncbi:MAG: sigma-70 family RNA polymerase sigma factor [Ardenticatenia bacterium]|nr:sigma-70 family RNA polymerase sigma factor [Ardenticatenia bacterium]